ncbi:MAG: Smr/MutS family protein [Hyphomicrobiales bacterium]
MAKRSGKNLSSEDRRLWKKVTDTVTPRNINSINVDDEFLAAMQNTNKSANNAHIYIKKSPLSKVAMPSYSPPVSRQKSPSSTMPPLLGYNKREKSRLSRGHTTIDGKIDLHGLTQDQAHKALHIFVGRAVASGWKNVLVITGKGTTHYNHSLKSYGEFGQESPGVLRRKVPLWLSEPSLRNMVLGYETASTSHGGTGALFVRLRKK